MGYQAGEIPMENVHGIAVSGGSFPAEIWRLMMEHTIGLRPARDFPDPKAYPVYQPFQRGPLALSYDPYYVAPATRRDRQHVDRHDARRPTPSRPSRDKPDQATKPPKHREARASRRAWPCSRSSRPPVRSPGGPTRRSSLGTAATSPGTAPLFLVLLIAAFAAYLARAAT